MRIAPTILKKALLIGVYKTTINIAAPIKLYNVWKNAVCLAVLELPNEAIQDVKHVPMLAPTTKQNALLIGNSDAEIKNTTIDVTTDDD